MTLTKGFPDELEALGDLIRARRMTRAFLPTELNQELVDELCDLARRSPSAGNTQAVEFLVLSNPNERQAYWSTTFTPEGAAKFAWPGLFSAPVLIVVMTRPQAYPSRYAESDKSKTGLGTSVEAWGVPYWWVDAGASAQNLLLAAQAAGLGALLFGLFDHETAVKAKFGVPEEYRLVATIAVGLKAADRPGRSAKRSRPLLEEIVHRGRFGTDD